MTRWNRLDPQSQQETITRPVAFTGPPGSEFGHSRDAPDARGLPVLEHPVQRAGLDWIRRRPPAADRPSITKLAVFRGERLGCAT
jgi:hypothetical protein